MNKFKVGDKVRLIGKEASVAEHGEFTTKVGTFGNIISQFTINSYCVEFVNIKYLLYIVDSDLESVSEIDEVKFAIEKHKKYIQEYKYKIEDNENKIKELEAVIAANTITITIDDIKPFAIFDTKIFGSIMLLPVRESYKVNK